MKIVSMIMILIILVLSGCYQREDFNVNNELSYCAAQAEKTLALIPSDTVLPRNVDRGSKDWRFVRPEDWTSGFWPGILWYLYEATQEEKWRIEADKYSRYLTTLSQRPATDHDLGFQVFSSFGNGYRLTRESSYKAVILRTADTLATLFNPKVGTILSWPGMVQEKGWPHNTIIDNMMNLELLFWASKNGSNKRLYDIALQHAKTTMQNHFHDYVAYHVVVYDTLTGEKIKGCTHQGLTDESMWARGQAWAIYGYTMVFRETQQQEFLDFAINVADQYLRHLPGDYVPKWDFEDTASDAPKDASAAAIAASALLELSQYVNKEKRNAYLDVAEKMLIALSSSAYKSSGENPAFLLHATGHKPNGTEIDASIIYGDYYYLEALLRFKTLHDGI